uniref:Uncharacterized protein n=1 Tax=Myxococcus xanthus TaxID=34 RepID=Q8KRC1_MYXXA|nr:unknown [Myxococcus xanthus DZF1]
MRKPERTKNRSTPVHPAPASHHVTRPATLWSLRWVVWKNTTSRTARPRTPSSTGR